MAQNEVKESLTDIKSIANETIKVVKDLNKTINNMNSNFEDLFDDLYNSIDNVGKKSQKSINKYFKDSFKDTEKSFDDIINSITTKTSNGVASISKIINKSIKDAIPKDAIKETLYENTIGSFLSKKGFSSFGNSWYNTLKANKINNQAYKLGMEGIEKDGIDELKSYNEQLSGLDNEIVNKQMLLNKLKKQHKKYSPVKKELGVLVENRNSLQQEKDETKSKQKEALTKSFKETKTANMTSLMTSLETDLIKVGIEAIKKLGQAIVKTFKEAYQTLLDTATYSTSTSLISNSSAREQQLSYGLNESQNYAFTQTKSLLGISSDEDLYYMNENQRAMFSKLMSKEMEFYEDMTQNGSLESFQEMQIDIKILKQEFMSKIVQFIANNKDAILEFVESALDILSNLLDGVSNILSFLGYKNKEETAGSKTSTLSTSEIQELLSNKYNNGTSTFDTTSVSSLSNNIDNSNNSSKTINVSINNNANLSSSKDASSVANQFSESSLKSLMTYFES